MSHRTGAAASSSLFIQQRSLRVREKVKDGGRRSSFIRWKGIGSRYKQVLRSVGHRWHWWGCNSSWACPVNEMRSWNHIRASPALRCMRSYETTNNLNACLRDRELNYVSLQPIFSALLLHHSHWRLPLSPIKIFLSRCILLGFLMARPVQTPPGRSNYIL